jgi:hypothetical protein
MSADIQNLQTAATSLVNTIMTASNNNSAGNVKLSVVPYVAAVNPGLTDMTMVDTTAASPYNGMWFTWAWIASVKGCTLNWGSGGGGTSSGPGGSSSGDAAADASDLRDLLNPFRRFANELFGVSSAHAQVASPSSVTPATGVSPTTTSQKDPVTNKTLKIPTGFNFQANQGNGTGNCSWLSNPATVSHYDLFSRIITPNGTPAVWKGCVEARPSSEELAAMGSSDKTDYDVTDTPPSTTNGNSLFVPYFWPDEPDWSYTTWNSSTNFWNYVAPGAWSSTNGGYHNNYLADGTSASYWSGWNWAPATGWGEGQYILKYNSSTKAAIINEQGPSQTYGPNASCPDAVLRLTASGPAVLSKISNLTYWYNGGTIISEGLMWAWRSLSPNKPYGDGKPYNTANNQKVIVLMTDGVNGLADNGNSSSANISDYSAYGYLGNWRLAGYAQVTAADPAVPSMPSDVSVPFGPGISTYDQLQTYFDVRLLKACANAKAQGITIYTVMFNHNGFLSAAEQAHSLSLLQKCATKPAYTYLATDAAALNSAFSSIGSTVTGAKVHLKL